MGSQEKKLRATLNRHGYILGKKDSGYRISDKVSNTIYLGEKFDAAWNDVVTFASNIDDGGYSSTVFYMDGDSEKTLSESYLESLEMDIVNLTRHHDTLISEGKHKQAQELSDKLQELEEELKDAEEYNVLVDKLDSFLKERGYRMEAGVDGYRVTHVETGNICIGLTYDASLDEAVDFAEKSLGFVHEQ